MLPSERTLMLPCRMVHTSLHPEMVHTAMPLSLHPTAKALLSGEKERLVTGPVSSTEYLRRTSPRTTPQGERTVSQ